MLNCPALRADNLLGFLAALGVCRLTNSRLAWQHNGPLWCAALDTDETIDHLAEFLLGRCKANPLDGLERALKLTVDQWLSLPPEWSAAIGTERADGFMIAQIIAVRGGSKQFPVSNIDKITTGLTVDDMRAALIGPWLRHPKFGMRWEPSEWHRHGDEWDDPSELPSMVARGPTRLAVEGLPLVPTLSPTSASMFRGRKPESVRWPVWKEPLIPEAVRGRVLAGVGEMTWECQRHHTGQAQWFLGDFSG